MPSGQETRYRITIKNWHEYQREMRGGEKRRRRREWVAISVDLFSDPDFLALDATHSRLWLGLLLHAGKVGPVFELSCSYARHLFDLRRSCDFRVLENHGFIDLQAATNKTNKTNRTRQTVAAKPQQSVAKKQRPKGVAKTSERFPEFYDLYPKKVGRKKAEQKWATMNLDKIADKIIDNIKYRLEHDVQWKRGYIKDPLTFLNGEHWEDEMIQTVEPGKRSYADSLGEGIKQIEEQRRLAGLDPKTGEPLKRIGGDNGPAN